MGHPRDMVRDECGLFEFGGWGLGHPILSGQSTGWSLCLGCFDEIASVQMGVACRVSRDVCGWGARGRQISRQVTVFHRDLRTCQVTVV